MNTNHSELSKIILYPSSPLNKQQVDECFEKEYYACQKIGLMVGLIDIENISKIQLTPSLLSSSRIVYRGWMLDDSKYQLLENRFGTQLLTSKYNYFMSHFLPNWYEDIKYLTIPSIITDENEVYEKFDQFEGKAFLKDYVKSLKTGKGSIVDSKEDISRAIHDMKSYKGNIEGGIVLRKVVELIPESETRYFVIRNVVYSPIINDPSCSKYQLANKVVKQLESKNLTFYSIDIALQNNAIPVVIEIGDGQVSDYVNWNVENFASILVHI